MGDQIHAARLEKGKNELEKYKKACINAKDSKEPEPEKPKKLMLYIPADNSKSGLVELADDNDGRAILYETEGDTLADALKTEHGGFSDVLRKAFHHEPVTFFRRTGKEYKEIKRPQVAVLLSSTQDQYLRLIPNAQNGLFSRFIHYHLTPCRDFKDVFDPKKRDYPETFGKLGKEFLGVYTELEKLADPIKFELRENQQTRFLAVFKEWKNEIGENVSDDLDGTVNRLGLICFRVAMLLTALRSFGEGDYSPTMICEDQDFDNALTIVDVLKRHALAVYWDLPRPTVSKDATKFENELTEKAAQVAQCKRLKDAGESYAQIALKVLGKADAANKTKVYRWLNR